MEKILIVEDDEEIRSQLKWGLDKDFSLLFSDSRGEAVPVFMKNLPGVVTLDLGLPPHENGAEEGLQCLEEILREKPLTKVIVLTGNNDRSNALRAIQKGAYDFYQKPVDLKELKVIISRAFHLKKIEEENKRLQNELKRKTKGLGDIYGQCPQMQDVFSTIRKVAPSDVPVLIIGESGTGKELVAKCIHELSLRKDGPFIPINCAAIPENLLESELFGYEKGAFTGANTTVPGKVEFANKGTLLLDEIGDLPLNLQVKLLRFLQEKMIQRVGGRENIEIDARIVAATNVDIVAAMEQGKFREDLYYRLGIITKTLPPLRERGQDIIFLANIFLNQYCEEFHKKLKGFSREAIEYIESYNWPGNVRELQNRIQRAVIMAESLLIDLQDLGFTGKFFPKKGFDAEGMTLKEAREHLEKEMLASALSKNGGNSTKAAEALGISRPTFYDLLKKYDL